MHDALHDSSQHYTENPSVGGEKAESRVFPSAARAACMPITTTWARRLDVEIVGAGMGAHGLTLRLLTKQVLWEEEDYNDVSVLEFWSR